MKIERRGESRFRVPRIQEKLQLRSFDELLESFEAPKCEAKNASASKRHVFTSLRLENVSNVAEISRVRRSRGSKRAWRNFYSPRIWNARTQFRDLSRVQTATIEAEANDWARVSHARNTRLGITRLHLALNARGRRFCRPRRSRFYLGHKELAPVRNE